MSDFDGKAVGRPKSPDEIVADLLQVIDRDGGVSQRQLAAHLGVALGLVNAYLKHCVGKGWIKVSKVPTRRFAYFLTPQGFAEKSRRTASFLSNSLHFFRRARLDCSEVMRHAVGRGWRDIGLVGAGELAEIAMLCATEAGLRVVVVADDLIDQDRVLTVPVVATPDLVRNVDGWIMTTIRDPQAAYDRVAPIVGPSRLLTPDLLSISGVTRRH
ncbi:MAG: winged helix-turn-helix transcriptional regulator [Rhizobiaceae bacterium]